MDNLIKQTKLLKLSTQASSGLCLNTDKNYKSSFQYTVPTMNLREEDIEYVYLSVPYCYIPVSFYIVDYTNNRLDVIENGVSKSFSFEAGNYNAASFMSYFKILLGANWSIYLDRINSVFTIVNSVNSFQLLGTSTIDFVMGFSETLTSKVVSAMNTVTCSRVCNFLPLPRVHLRCRQFANSCLISQNCDSDILLSVPNDSINNGKIVYSNSSGLNTIHLEVPYIQSFVINFTNESGELINFNGLSSFFELQFDIYKKRPEKPPTFRKVIQELSRILE